MANRISADDGIEILFIGDNVTTDDKVLFCRYLVAKCRDEGGDWLRYADAAERLMKHFAAPPEPPLAPEGDG